MIADDLNVEFGKQNVTAILVLQNILKETSKMKKIVLTLLAISLSLSPMSSAFSAEAIEALGFNAASIKGFPTGEARLTGGGAYDAKTGFVHSAGGFRCLEDINQGPLAGCKAGEGVRWDTEEVLPNFMFKCTGAASEALKPVVTDDNTVVLRADFYRQGDGNMESFTAVMFVSEVDEASDLPGIQNVWIQGVGCGHAIANFN
ncbi:MAG TPA: hypothetical protein VIE89_14910 [Candidatus Binatia bacterium]